MNGPAGGPSPPPPPTGVGNPSPIRAGSKMNVNPGSPGKQSGSTPAARAGSAAHVAPPKYNSENGSLLTQDTELQLANTFGTAASQGTSLSRETTDIQGNRVRETTTVSTMPDGTTIRTTETTPLDPNRRDVIQTTVHERTEPSGRMTRMTLTSEPDGTKIKRTETIRPGGSKTVNIETTDPNGRRNVETADYPPTLVTPPTNYGQGSGMTVVSEITYPQTYAPWVSRPVDVDEMKEVGASGGSEQTFWTKRRKGIIICVSILLMVGGVGAVVGIFVKSSSPGTGEDQALEGDYTAGGEPDSESENDADVVVAEPQDSYPDLTPQAVGFDHQWPIDEGWVVAPSYAGTGQSYYRPFLMDDLGLCADRCSKTEYSAGGAFFPRINGSLCYCFAAIDCVEPTLQFSPGGTVFAVQPRPDSVCVASMCTYFPDDLLCDGVDLEEELPSTPAPSRLPTASPTDAPAGVDLEEELPPTPAPSRSPTASPTDAPAADPVPNFTEPDVDVAVGLITDTPTTVPTPLESEEEAECTVGPVEREVPCADFRYIPWSKLSSTRRQLAQLKLNYDETTWNNPGTATIESLSWDQLSADQLVGAKLVGFELQPSWDCHQNHYRSYSWDALESEGVQVYYRLLGWSEANWPNDVPETNELAWSLLSSEQRDAARELCYSRVVWDGMGL